LNWFLDFLEWIKFFIQKKGRNVEMNYEGWITKLGLLVDVTAHLNNHNKELWPKNKLIAELYDTIKAYKVNLRLWENQLKLNNLIHFLKLWEYWQCLYIIYSHSVDTRFQNPYVYQSSLLYVKVMKIFA
jgi:hypothetical protein